AALPSAGDGRGAAPLLRTGRAAWSVVKVGGSLVSDPERLRAVLSACLAQAPIAVVPGGGPFAEAVRTSQAALGYDDRLAHRLALDAMGRMAEILCALEPRLTVAADVDAVASVLGAGGCVVWDPAALKAGAPDIAESWAVTSDSLALWLATRLGAGRCILEKAAPVPDADPQALAAAGLVDAAFPRFAAAFPGAIVVRGPERAERAA
ncbi:amino acid kinase family protein, partial [Methylobacterium sp. Leaf118]|uniref:amino acid kinase family protein n=1 Tax=Methylobacterium sp. Leaf118 TaxID=2876562 RepID=UPI001E54A601